jgi:hypothetical protein
MKKIELKLIEQSNENQGLGESWKDILIAVIKHVNHQSPLNLEQMHERLKVINKVKEVPHGGILNLEDAEFTALFTCMSTFPIFGVNETLANCFDTIKKIQETK